MEQFKKKTVRIDRRATKEYRNLPEDVQPKFRVLFERLEEDGVLMEPNAKKLSGSRSLFELRVKHRGQWRAIYAYVIEDTIVVLSFFSKKRQTTPRIELEKAKNRLQDYL